MEMRESQEHNNGPLFTMSTEGPEVVEFHKAKTILTEPPAPYFNEQFFF